MLPFLTLHHPSAAKAYYANGLWRDDTFYGLLESHAQTHCASGADTVALRDAHRQLGWQELHDEVDRVSTALQRRGIGAGDTVCLWLSNRLEVIVIFLACARLGIACNPSLHKTFTCAEVTPLLRRLKASVLITESGWGADRDEQHIEDLVANEVIACDVLDLVDLWHDAKACDPSRLTPAIHDPDIVSYLAFTSGTTGEPKCVMHSANTLLANARDLATDWSLACEATLMSMSPLSHHIAWVGVAQWLAVGCQFVSGDPPPSMDRLAWIEATGATYVLGVPTHVQDLLALQRKAGRTRIGSVQVMYMAGSPIPPVVAEALSEQGIRPQNVYGMTENSSHQYTHASDTMAVATRTCGRGGRAYAIRIFDVDHPERELAVGETGQIGGRGAALMLGYHNDQLATAGSFNRDGWFLSGDLGSVDEHGNLTVEGRLKDLIIRGGHNIYPARIEALAHRHPHIDKAAAFGVSDDRLGERVCLAVIGRLDGPTVLRHLRQEGLSPYDMPEFFIQAEAFPLTASGKILKRALAKAVAEGGYSVEAVDWQSISKGEQGEC